MENNSLGMNIGEEINDTNGSPEPSLASISELDPTKGYIDLNAQGWITAKINLRKGLYEIIGFLAQVQDIVRVEIAKAIKREEQKVIKPGWRGFSPFKR